ncbi:acyl-CoA thioesterase [Pseudoblastomonas halimionae]|nr:acyl-CoA thioesterase II [Alteriqipengyuania halimionae]
MNDTERTADERHPSPKDLVDGLVTLLTPEETVGHDIYRGPRKGDGVGRVFGGQVIAQALRAAEMTVEDDRPPHSLHAYFLRGGSEDYDIELAVDRQFDGRSFSNRRVVAKQKGTPILNLAASFQRPEEGLEHVDATMPDVPSADELRPEMEIRAEMANSLEDERAREFMLRPRAIELRNIDAPHWQSSEPRDPVSHTWFRAVAPMPDDASLHRAALAYASDYMLLGTSALPHGLSWWRNELKGASLDHAVWFHRPARLDEWLLYATDSPWSGGGRGFNRGSVFNQDGELVASVAQEGVIRKMRKDS